MRPRATKGVRLDESQELEVETVRAALARRLGGHFSFSSAVRYLIDTGYESWLETSGGARIDTKRDDHITLTSWSVAIDGKLLEHEEVTDLDPNTPEGIENLATGRFKFGRPITDRNAPAYPKGSIVLVDAQGKLVDGAVCALYYKREPLVGRYRARRGDQPPIIVFENPAYDPIVITDESAVIPIGVIVGVARTA